MYKREDIKEGMEFVLNPRLLEESHPFWNRVAQNIRKYLTYSIKNNLKVKILEAYDTDQYFAKIGLKYREEDIYYQTYYLSIQDINEMFLPQDSTLQLDEDYYQ